MTEHYHQSSRLKGFDTPTVWQEFSGLAQECRAVNLGQGFPDWSCPEFAKLCCAQAVNQNYNQYSRAAGNIDLVHSLARKCSKYLKRTINPLTEISTTVGATEALFNIMLAYLEIGDEVIMLEPAFDTYPAQVQLAGGVCKYSYLLPPVPGSVNWTFDIAGIETLITPKTKVFLLNTPHNPSGKVFSYDELLQISEIFSKYPNILIVTDEVYEHLIYDNNKHTHFATLPNMWERTLTISSAGKTFSTTGWKIGWVVGSAELVKPLNYVSQWTRFCVNTPCQKAVADMIDFANNPYEGFETYYDYLRDLMQKRRNRLTELAGSVGFRPLQSEGGYFLICDTTDIRIPDAYLQETDAITGIRVTPDRAFCRWLTREIGVAAIPLSAFYPADRAHLVSHLIRFCVCKEEATIEEAGRRLVKVLDFRV